MLPSVLATQLIKGTKEFLKTTFPGSTRTFMGITEKFVEKTGNLYKGPYVSVALPFRKGSSQQRYFPEVVDASFEPYYHQELAFKRLGQETPKPTLVATGTGSGKTESFMFPVLEHCRKNLDLKGIKAIIIYPMNALATDQSKRFARTIAKNPGLNGITVGLFVGGEEKQASIAMSADQVITCKDTLRRNPPDVLLTNYKMLDWLLMRPRDQSLWSKNTGNQLLKFIAVDEIHTFDGAQGTDLASLLRRLKARLKVKDGQIGCIGTSATLGNDGSEGIRSFASKVFSQEFEEDSIICEYRISADEFFLTTQNDYFNFPDLSKFQQLEHQNFETMEAYLARQYELWFYEKPEDIASEDLRIDLGQRLKELSLFKLMLEKLDGKISHINDLVSAFKKRINIRNAPEAYFHLLVNSLLSLTSWARGEKLGSYLPPFLHVRVQLWLRELNRMVARLDNETELIHSQDISGEDTNRYYPVIHCRDCNAMGWGGVEKEGEECFENDLKLFYQTFFSRDHRTRIFFPFDTNEESMLPDKAHKRAIDPITGQLYWLDQQEAKDAVRVVQFDMLDDKHKFKNQCPYCSSHNSLTILGSRAASLTSVLIGQTFASVYNDDKKLIAFSDSVQDAAHRAGFFGARSYQFTLRSCMQQALLVHESPVKIGELGKVIEKYWSNKFNSCEEYAARLIAPDMIWLEDYDQMKKTGRLSVNSNLLDLVNLRIDWMIYSEYGFRSNIGRTLEHSGASVADFNLADISFDLISARLENEFETFRAIDRNLQKKIIFGLLVRMKKLGAIYNDHLTTYVSSAGNLYAFNKLQRFYLPSMSKKSRAPKFLTFLINDFEKIINKSGSTWCYKWLEKNLTGENFSLAGGMTASIYQRILDELAKTGLVQERQAKDAAVWGLNPEFVFVTTDICRFVCDFCKQELVVSAQSRQLAEGMKCLRHNCHGRYHLAETRQDYYQQLYSRGDLKRIVAEEHTGLLKREERERVEKDFTGRNEAEAWKTNLLSATPTLEMGIDIGDLSTVVLCSVPPGNSNYMQRIGRAGRTDGNAINTTIANGNDHDLYFYSDPFLMLQGKMSSPGIFIDASAILQRQFLAFCMDSWVYKNKISEKDLPVKLIKILANLGKDDKKGLFPFSLINFIQSDSNKLLAGFLGLYGNELNQTTREQLKLFAEGKAENLKASDAPDELKEGDSLAYKILNRLEQVRKEEESLSRNITALNDELKKMKEKVARDADHDEVVENIQNELDGLKAVRKDIREKRTFEFFTNEGLLPNYTFPESGVTLKSVIYRKREKKAGQKAYDTFTYEYERAGTSALSELAPCNAFYAGGRKAVIDQIDLTLSDLEKWRFCDKCSYSASATYEVDGNCPKCGSEMWPDAGRIGNLLRLRQVMANTRDRDSRLTDDSDQRNPMFYARQMLIDFEAKDIQDAYAIDNDKVPFGFEFLSRATFREINFGQLTAGGESVEIAGASMKRPGFVICRYCGKVQKTNPRNEFFKPVHTFTCNAQDPKAVENFVESLYLYREFSSEAIRILLPISSLSISDVKLHSLIAAFHMGLKDYFKGSVDHLQIRSHIEARGEDMVSQKYLVLYDSVPGGTGYLRQLMREGKPVFEILELAIKKLESCECNSDYEKDGCYQCIFAYKNNFDRPKISRNKAREIINEILEVKDQIKKVQSVSEISTSGLNDSELEERFLVELGNYEGQSGKAKLKKVITSSNLSGYLLEIGNQSYEIEQQVPLGEKDGVSVYSKADFVIRPISNRSLKPIVVFTDGFSFHHHRLHSDTAQRMAIVAGGKYIVWSLTWDDVTCLRENREKNRTVNYLSENYCSKKRFSLIGSDFHRLFFTSFDWLLEILEKGSAHDFVPRAQGAAVGLAQAELFSDNPGLRKLSVKLSENIFNSLIDLDESNVGIVNENEKLIFAVAAQLKDLNKKNFENITALVHLNDVFDVEVGCWAGALRMYNLFQFLKTAWFTCDKGLEENSYATISFENLAELPESGQWTAAFADADEEIAPILKELAKHIKTIPEQIFEVIDKNGEIVAQFDLAWPDFKVGMVLDSEDKIENSDWKQFEVSELTELINEIKSGEAQ
jgi:DEAD/DEAH box helicase domain-containing protein